MNSTISWYVTQCYLIEVYRSCGGTYCLHLQGRIVSRASNQITQPTNQWVAGTFLRGKATVELSWRLTILLMLRLRMCSVMCYKDL
jgi:hypothetical protein